MLAAILDRPRPISERPLQIRETPVPTPGSNQVLLKVSACGVCRTDLHISEGELPVVKPGVIPGHQIVGDVVDGATPELPGIAAPARKISAIRPPSRATPWMVATRSMPSLEEIPSFRCRRAWTTC